MDDFSIKSAESEFEVAALKKRIRDLEAENGKLKILLKEVDETASIDTVTDAELICQRQLQILKDSSDKRELTRDEISALDLLHKNIKIARGEDIRVRSRGKAKKMSTEELANILKDK